MRPFFEQNVPGAMKVRAGSIAMTNPSRGEKECRTFALPRASRAHTLKKRRLNIDRRNATAKARRARRKTRRKAEYFFPSRLPSRLRECMVPPKAGISVVHFHPA